MESKKGIAKFVLGIIGAIVLGALGSGLWNVFLGPLFSIAYNSILTIATFGISAIKNNSYIAIAKGLHEQPSLEWLLIFSTGMIAIPLAIMSFALFLTPLLNRISKKIEEKEKAKGIEYSTKMVVIFSLIAILISSWFMIVYALFAYENKAVTHFTQCFTICKPYIDTKEEKTIQASFSKIKNREDYVRVLKVLQEIATRNGDEIPKFDPW
jgi:hypothetical protein